MTNEQKTEMHELRERARLQSEINEQTKRGIILIAEQINKTLQERENPYQLCSDIKTLNDHLIKLAQ
jgi:hypothetical protein